MASMNHVQTMGILRRCIRLYKTSVNGVKIFEHKRSETNFVTCPNIETRALPLLAPNAKEFAMEGKVFIEKVLEATTKGVLLDCKGLVSNLLLCLKHPLAEKQEALLGQVRIAHSKHRQGWLKMVAKDADCLEFGSRAWIEEHISLLPKLKKKTSESLAYTRDIRLKTDKTLEHRVENAASGEACDSLLTEMESLLDSMKEPVLDYGEGTLEVMDVSEGPEGSQGKPEAVEDKENVVPTPGVKRAGPIEEEAPRKRSKNGASGQAEQGDVAMDSIPETTPVEKRRSRRVCPLTWCKQDFSYPKAHVFNFHCPTKLDMDAEGKRAARDRLEAIEFLARQLTGREDATGASLVDYISSHHMAEKHQGKMISSWLARVVRDVGKVSRGRYPVPRVLRLNPLSSPALIFHWAILLEILSRLESSRYNAFIRRFSKPDRSSELNQKLASVDGPQEKPKKTAKGDKLVVPEPAEGVDLVIRRLAGPSGKEVRSVLVKEGDGACSLAETSVARKETQACSFLWPVLPAFDSHFHMDRLRRKVKTSSWTIRDIEENRERGTVSPAVKVTGGVANFCDPDTYPSVDVIRRLKDQGIAVTVGLHPKFAARASSSVMKHLKELVAMSEVAGLGEVGLDQTVPSDEWPLQRDVLAECLAMLEPRHVLVLHCRASCQDARSDLFTSLFYHLCAVVPQEQLIHLHCFDGHTSDVRRWTDKFPNVYLGFTLRVEEGSFGQAEKKALQAVKKERLLLESDAPYFAPKGTKWSSPGCIGMTARSVAKMRGEEYAEVLSQTWENAHRLYIKKNAEDNH